MANYAYIERIQPPIRREAFLPMVADAVHDVLGPRWQAAWADFKLDGPTILVTVPGTAKYVEDFWGAANGDCPPEDVGFTVSLKTSRRIAFRHSLNMEFARWAQGCIEEELSERLNAPLYYDAGPTTYKPGRCEYRRGKTLRQYLLRNFFDGKVEDAEHEAMLQRMMRGTPAGFDQ
jgi:hypothetical protein